MEEMKLEGGIGDGGQRKKQKAKKFFLHSGHEQGGYGKRPVCEKTFLSHSARTGTLPMCVIMLSIDAERDRGSSKEEALEEKRREPSKEKERRHFGYRQNSYSLLSLCFRYLPLTHSYG
jgi:hypothetical protein